MASRTPRHPHRQHLRCRMRFFDSNKPNPAVRQWLNFHQNWIDMTDKTYALHINASQAQVISTACEVLARLGIGQFRDALEHLPLRDTFPSGWHEDMDAIAHILKKYTANNVGAGTHYSIGGHKTSEASKTAWDLYQVVRHRLAWDANSKGNPMSVAFDTPIKTGAQPLAWLEVKE